MFDNLSEKLEKAFKKFRNKGKMTEADVKEGLREVKLALLEADVNFKVVRDFTKKVTERAVGSEVLESLLPGQQVVKIVHEELIKLMGEANTKLQISSRPPTVVMMVGLQGSGKTTHSAKLAGMYKKQGKRPLLVACDIYAIEFGEDEVDIKLITVDFNKFIDGLIESEIEFTAAQLQMISFLFNKIK